ncbi:MAG TPA: pitrilysin family protein [Gemmatimonadaceae bacterium]|nr:pitrilysin family protein [Gemmatimonadaceae bacterium]
MMARLAAVIAWPFVAALPAVAQRAPLRPLSYTRFVLPNGLVALLNEDHTAPSAVVDIWYHIGSKDDKPGRTGMAHLCEHLYSFRPPHLTQNLALFYVSLGAASTHFANTTEDITHFYVTLPSNVLETVLWAESDRLVSPFGLVDSAQMASVLGVVARERQANFEAVPYGVFRELNIAAIYPPGHPYHFSPIPPMADLYAATVSDLREQCRPYYAPNNAVISISGDFNPAQAKAWITKYFGGIPRTAVPARVVVPRVTLAKESRVVLEDSRVNVTRLAMSWPGAAFTDSSRAALRAVAYLLTAPRFGRLSKLVVDDRKLATNVIAENIDMEKGGVFQILAFPRPGVSLTALETVVDSVIAGLSTAPFTQRDVERFNAYDGMLATESLQSRYARADTLAHGEIFAGDPVAYAKQTNAARALRPSDLQAAAKRYLTPGRVVMSMVPAGKLDLVSKPNLPYENVTPPSSVQRKTTP